MFNSNSVLHVSNSGRGTGYPEGGFPWFSSIITITVIVTESRSRPFLSQTFVINSVEASLYFIPRYVTFDIEPSSEAEDHCSTYKHSATAEICTVEGQRLLCCRSWSEPYAIKRRPT